MEWANYVVERWEFFLLGFYTLEKIIKLSPSKKDDDLFDAFLKPVWESITKMLKIGK